MDESNDSNRREASLLKHLIVLFIAIVVIWLPAFPLHVITAHSTVEEIHKVTIGRPDSMALIYKPSSPGESLDGATMYKLYNELLKEGLEPLTICNNILIVIRKGDPLLLSGGRYTNGHFTNREVNAILGSIGLEPNKTYLGIIDQLLQPRADFNCTEPIVVARVPVFRDGVLVRPDVNMALTGAGRALGAVGLDFRLEHIVHLSDKDVEEALSTYKSSMRELQLIFLATSTVILTILYTLKRWRVKGAELDDRGHRSGSLRWKTAAAALALVLILAALYLDSIRSAGHAIYPYIRMDVMLMLTGALLYSVAVTYLYAMNL